MFAEQSQGPKTGPEEDQLVAGRPCLTTVAFMVCHGFCRYTIICFVFCIAELVNTYGLCAMHCTLEIVCHDHEELRGRHR